ncbi:serine protease SP24D [Drosophila pseudoobscura]|uniref:trypsin n=1 Tax=Drosophila pseudoobscura pseudoobscura TaxID=46245 RepID=A0A6I8UHK3_DROPS|nr:serine protease SP24D [Drosophila pseudoobscura]
MSLRSPAFLLLVTCIAGGIHGQDLDDGASPRIVGGTRAVAGQFPHQISLRHNKRFTCGGSILSSSYVLTAAHCVKSGKNVTPASELSIRAGSLRLSSGGVLVNVAQVIVHPQYGGSGYDVAVLRLASPLKFSSHIKAISLATSDPPSNSIVDISGWGAIFQNGPVSDELLYAHVRALARDTCKQRYYGSLSDTTMCLLHEAEKGACHGDSGGPATYAGSLVGVASFVLGGCGRSAPDGYERVSVLRPWIRQNAKL